jgi:hypothetical protein
MNERTTPRIGQVRFEIYASPDASPVTLQRHAEEPPEGFEHYVAAIKERVRRGDVCAWCEIVVIAKFGDYAGKSTCVRQVSVSSLEDFVNTHPQYEPLRREAFERLCMNIAIDESMFALGPMDPSPTNLAH